MPSGVHVFAVLLHAHLAGRAIRARHIRQQVELPPLASDDQFDFNFQEFQPLSQERLILPVSPSLFQLRPNLVLYMFYTLSHEVLIACVSLFMANTQQSSHESVEQIFWDISELIISFSIIRGIL